MKFRSLFMTVAAGLLLAGCSNNEPATPGEVPFEGDGDMYVSLKFTNGTRAVDYENGSADESAIRDVTIYFFDDAKKYLGSGVGVIQKEEGSTGNVEKKVKVEVTNDLVKEGKYALAVVNKVAALDAIAAGVSYDEFNAALTIASTADAKQGFMMTNSVYTEDGTNEYNLVAISANNWAEKGNAAAEAAVVPLEIYVERVTSKVTLGVDITTENTEATVNVISWGLNVMNKSYYPVKKLQSFLAEYNTFTNWSGITNQFWNKASDHRSFWAVDPNYTTALDAQDADVFFYPAVADMKYAANGTTAVYTLENTMQYNQQRVPTTTNAVLFAQYLPNDLGLSTDKNWYVWKNRNYTGANLLSSIVSQVNQKYYKKTGVQDEQGQDQYTNLELSDFEITFGNGTDVKIGDVVVGNTGKAVVTLKAGVEAYVPVDIVKPNWIWNQVTAATVNTDLLAAAGGEGAITTYVNGYCYYEIPIQQFADEVAWNGTDDPLTAKHMMRYGVVRNHVYKLVVNSIMSPGRPVTGTTVDPTPRNDDKKEYELKVNINVLAWAVRTQNVGL